MALLVAVGKEENTRKVSDERWLGCCLTLEPRTGNQDHLETAQLEPGHFLFFIPFPSFPFSSSLPSKLVG